jgi:hypothetical protein
MSKISSLRRSTKKRSRVFSSEEEEDDEADLENVSKKVNSNSIPNHEDVTRNSSLNSTKNQTIKKPEFVTRVLEKTLKQAGLELDFSSDPAKAHKLSCDQAVFQTKLSKSLKQFLNPDDGEAFNTELIALLEWKDDALYKALNPTRTLSSCSTARSTGKLVS